jgi:hypothetical protein
MMMIWFYIYVLQLLIVSLPVTEAGHSMAESYPKKELKKILRNASYTSPNLYFIGVSKGGTTSMIHILTQHPLVVGVGNSAAGNSAGESHIMNMKGFDSIDQIKQEETIRLQHNLKNKNAQV